MPFPREHTRRRQQLMTLIMWLVLLGAVGVAALVSRAPVEDASAVGPAGGKE